MTTGTSTTGTTSTGTTSTGTSSSSSTSSTSSTSSSSGDSSGASTTGGPVAACTQVAADHGDCEAALGWGFDGTSCKPISGCDCGPDCGALFADPVLCASTCAAAGECRGDIVHAKALAMDPVGPGSLCDQVDACVELPELKTQLTQLFPGLSCEQGGLACDSGETCHLLFQSVLDQASWTQICAATLLPGVDALFCVVFGP